MSDLVISNCRCGRKAEVTETYTAKFYILCKRNGCWRGPVRKTKREAIKAWNRVMGGKK